MNVGSNGRSKKSIEMIPLPNINDEMLPELRDAYERSNE